MCGLFGFSGKEKPNIEKIKILGLYNQKRGEHSCGVWYNDVLKKGFDKNKLFSDFIQDNVLPHERPAHNVLIGHTRWATTGAHTEGNAHPFLIDNEDGKMVIAHNGTISNIWTLTAEHKIDSKLIHVDSLALGHIINKDGFKVLNDYKGYAALLFQKLDEPDSLYVYHGASKNKPNEDIEWEERPMYYMQTKEGIYFSSLEEALKAIKDSPEQEPKTLPHNVVYKFTKGVFTKIKHEVKRGDINVEYPTYHQRTYGGAANAPKVPQSFSARGSGVVGKAVKPIIWQETLTPRAKADSPCVYYHKGRYHYSVDRILCTGTVYLNKKGIVKAKGAHGANPYWFFKGVMLKSEKFLQHLQGLKPDMSNIDITKENNQINSSYGNFALAISKYSVLPVTHLQNEGINVAAEFRHLWYHDSKSTITLGYTPKFSNRSYALKDGVFDKVSSPDKKEAPLLHEDSKVTIWDKDTEWDNDRGIWRPKAEMKALGIIPKSDDDLAKLNNHLQANLFKDLKAELGKTKDENCCLVGASTEIKAHPDVIMYDGDGNEINLSKYKDKLNSYNDKYDIKTQYLVKIWHKVFTNVEDALDEMGSTNILALTYYLEELYKHEFGATLGNEEMRSVVNGYLKECIQSNISLEENMVGYNAETQKWLSTPEFYIEMAIDFEADDIMINTPSKDNATETNDLPFDDKGMPLETIVDAADKDQWPTADDPATVEQEKKDAIAEFKNLWVVLKDLETKADEFQYLNTSDMAQEISFQLYTNLDCIRKELASIARENGLEELYSKYTNNEIV